MALNSFAIPDPKEIAHTFTWLLGRDVRVAAAGRLSTSRRDAFTIGVFINEQGEIVGAVAADIPCSGGLGAALSLYPPHQVKEMIASGTFDEGVWLNTLEVFNVVSRYFHDGFEGMITLGKSWNKVEDVPDEVWDFVRRAKKRVDLQVNVPGYTGGAMALMAAA